MNSGYYDKKDAWTVLGLKEDLIKHGSEIHKSIQPFYAKNGYRGLTTCSRIKKGEILMKIPYDLFITKSLAKKSSILKYVEGNKNDMSIDMN